MPMATTDRAADPQSSGRFYAPVRLGATQSFTPEGFLLCEAVPIARTGELLYVAGEIKDLKAGRDGILHVQRDAAALFSPTVIASFEGKPVTDNHPAEWISPANWRRFAVGTVQNVRRGEADQLNLLLADLLITDASAIASVRSGKREVSCGYDAEYLQDEPGQAVQVITQGNHVALVASGRCGTSCSIGDEDPMKKRSLADRIRTAFRAQDEAALNEELENVAGTKDEDGAEEPQKLVIEVRQTAPEAAVVEEPAKDEGAAVDPIAALTDAVAKLAERLTALEAAIAKPADKTGDADGEEEEPKKTEDGDDEKDEDKKGERTTDSAGLAALFQDTLARAEILVPGIALPAFDAKASAATTQTALAGLRLKALGEAYGSDQGKAAIHTFDAAPDFKAMTMDAARVLFMAASESVKASNNGRLRSTNATRDKAVAPARTPADLNKANREFYGRAG